MPRYALVDQNGSVVNVVVWDGITPWTPPKGFSAVMEDGDTKAEPGGTYDGKTFSPAVIEAVESGPSETDRISALETKIAELSAKVDASAPVSKTSP